MPSERFVEALNEQIAREFAAAQQYTAIGAWYDSQTLPRLAAFFNEQAEEERGHARKMIRYLLDTGAPVRIGAVPAARCDFSDHVEPIRTGLEQERQNTVAISKLFEIARETRDHASEVFMHWFISEQVEEERVMGDLLQVAERVRDFPMALEEFLAREGENLRDEE